MGRLFFPAKKIPRVDAIDVYHFVTEFGPIGPTASMRKVPVGPDGVARSLLRQLPLNCCEIGPYSECLMLQVVP
jgi:hypothetical protein